MTEHFRRADPRYDRHVEVEVEVGGRRQRATTKNLSLGGMFVQTETPPPAGTPVVVHFQVPTQPEPIDVRADVRWTDRDGGMGVRFQGLRARDVWALNRFFQAASTRVSP